MICRMPDDVADATEQMKLVILSHKLSGWDAIYRDNYPWSANPWVTVYEFKLLEHVNREVAATYETTQQG